MSKDELDRLHAEINRRADAWINDPEDDEEVSAFFQAEDCFGNVGPVAYDREPEDMGFDEVTR